MAARRWARARLGSMADPIDPPGARPWTLRAAVALVSAEALVEAVAVAGRSSLTPGLRAVLVVCIGLKWVFAWRVLHLSAGATLGLLLLEGTTVVAALGATDSPTVVRIALAVTAAAVVGLVLASLHAFPSPALPGTGRAAP
jgi:hypothetical protein